MKFIYTAFICAVISLGVTACAFGVKPQLDENGVGVAVVPLTTLERTQAGEAMASEFADATAATLTELASGQATLAEALGQVEVAKQAMIESNKLALAALSKQVDQAKLELADKAETDWVTLLGGVLGISVASTGSIAGIGKYRKHLLNKPAPGQEVAA